MKRMVWLAIIVIVVAATAAGGGWYFTRRALTQTGAQTTGGTATAMQTAKVTSVTELSSIQSSGSVAPLQQESLSWKATGTVATVNVKVGDTVKKGDVLMSLDVASVSQSVLQAQVDLVSAKTALANLQHPSNTDISTARKAVVDAEQALKDAEQNLKYVENPLSQTLYDTLADKKLALETALANQQLARVGSESSAVKTSLDDKNLAYSRLQRAQTAMDDCNKISCGERVQRENELNAAQQNYQKADNAYNAAVLTYNTSVANQGGDVRTAQKAYDEALANVNAAKAGPNPLSVKTYTAAVEVAKADLADKQRAFAELIQGGNADDLAAAEAKVLSAQATLDTTHINAPFDGEILEVNYLPGDTANSTDAAVVIANRSQLHVDVAVDEADISDVAAGNVTSLTFDSLPSLSLDGSVAQIIPYGTVDSGLVKYTVRVNMKKIDPKVLIGMTSSVTIITGSHDGVLAVPYDAIQLSGTQEYVNRVQVDGTIEKVNVVSGSQQGDLITVTGGLKVGDTLQVPTKTATTTTNRGGGPLGGP
jgi:HlyD family secretion protein